MIVGEMFDSVRRLEILGLIFVLASLGGCGECEDDYACPSSQICNTEKARCEAYGCRQDRECAPGHRCLSNQCQVQAPKKPPDDIETLPAGQSNAAPSAGLGGQRQFAGLTYD